MAQYSKTKTLIHCLMPINRLFHKTKRLRSPNKQKIKRKQSKRKNWVNKHNPYKNNHRTIRNNLKTD